MIAVTKDGVTIDERVFPLSAEFVKNHPEMTFEEVITFIENWRTAEKK